MLRVEKYAWTNTLTHARPIIWSRGLTLIFFIGKRVTAGPHLDLERGSDELEVCPEPPLEITLVDDGHVLQRIAVDHDHRRVHAALVGVAQLRAERAGAARLLVLDGLVQQPREHRR